MHGTQNQLELDPTDPANAIVPNQPHGGWWLLGRGALSRLGLHLDALDVSDQLLDCVLDPTHPLMHVVVIGLHVGHLFLKVPHMTVPSIGTFGVDLVLQ